MVNVSFFLQNIGYMLNPTMIILGNWEVQETGEFIRHFDSSLTRDCNIEHGLLEKMLQPLAVSGIEQTLQVTVSLTSGRSASLSIPLASTVGDLKTIVQESLGKPFLRLITADRRKLKPSEFLEAAGLQDGDQLTAIVGEAKLAATRYAFALWCCGGDRVLTWGHLDFGGDSSAVQDQLKSVQQVQATHKAFAAILEDGSVVTWGDPFWGGDSSAVQEDQLKKVRQVQGTRSAFAAILEDGSVVAWGDPASGGDSSAVKNKLKKVRQVQASEHAFAAILEDGCVVNWGHFYLGGDSSAVQDQLKSVQQVQA